MTARRSAAGPALAARLVRVVVITAFLSGCQGALPSGTNGGSPSGVPAPSTVTWSDVAFGDSVSFGEGDVNGASFVPLLAKLIERDAHVQVSVQNLAFDGGTSQTLL